MYGIPNMKLDKTVITRRQKLMEEEGVVFFTDCNIDEHESDRLKAEYDAVILCCGAKQARKLKGADPEKIRGIYYAVDYLTSVTKSILASGDYSGRTAETAETEEKRRRKDPISASGKHVVVVGGGDTGNDCIGTAIRQGCASVTAMEMMPKPPAVRREDNPWPQWPKVLKTDYGHEEAIALWGQDPRIYETTVKEYITGRGGRLKQIVTVKVRFEDGKLKEVPGSEQTLRCDILLIAAGFTGCEAYTPQAFGVEQTSRGCVRTEAGRYQTSVPGIFTAGDMHRGQSLVVWAIAEGRAAAAEVDRYLMGYERQ
jgi:glutamate synthase (NADPH/NADH) small chain